MSFELGIKDLFIKISGCIPVSVVEKPVQVKFNTFRQILKSQKYRLVDDDIFHKFFHNLETN